MDKIYFYTTNGDIVDNDEISNAYLITTGNVIKPSDYDTIREYIKFCKGIKEEIENPTVEMFLKTNHKVKAIHLFYKQHPGISIADAKICVERMYASMKPATCDIIGYCPFDNKTEGFPCVGCPRDTN